MVKFICEQNLKLENISEYLEKTYTLNFFLYEQMYLKRIINLNPVQ